MLSFDSDGVGIAYSDEGEGEPILLIHGFASNVAANWGDVGWIGALAAAGRRVIALAGMGKARSSTIRAATVRRRWRRMRAGCSTISASPAPT